MIKRHVKKSSFKPLTRTPTGATRTIGSLSFIFGVSIAVITGLVTQNTVSASLTSVLIFLGLVVGILNITTKEINSFLLATLTLVIVSALGGAILGQVAIIGKFLEGILLSILTFTVPAAIIVATRSLYSLAKN
jgi:hypothetical protein